MYLLEGISLLILHLAFLFQSFTLFYQFQLGSSMVLIMMLVFKRFTTQKPLQACTK